MALGWTQPPTLMCTRYISWGGGWEKAADVDWRPCQIHVSTVQKFWEPQTLESLRACPSLYRDCLTYPCRWGNYTTFHQFQSSKTLHYVPRMYVCFCVSCDPQNNQRLFTKYIKFQFTSWFFITPTVRLMFQREISPMIARKNEKKVAIKVCKSVHHHTIQTNQPTKCNNFSSLLLDVYVQLNMFRASSRPSSGAQQLQ